MKYLREQYIDNVKTNIKTHCESRLRKFFRMCVYELNDEIRRQNVPNATLYTEQDVKNAVKFTYKQRRTINGDAGTEQRLRTLLDELILCGLQHSEICGGCCMTIMKTTFY